MKVVHLFYSFPNKWQPYSHKLLLRLHNAGIQTVAVSAIFPQEQSRTTLNDLPFNVVYPNTDVGYIKHIYKTGNSYCQLKEIWKDRGNVIHWKKNLGWTTVFRYWSVLRLRPDIVHVHHFHATSQSFLEALSYYQIPWIVSLRGFDVMVKPLTDLDWYKRLQWVFRNATAIHAVSQDIKQRAIELGATAEKIFVIRRSLEVEEAKSISSVLEPPYKLISVGRVVWQKGHIYAVDALAQLLKANIPVQYEIIGDGPLEEAVYYRAWQLGVTDQIKITGYVENDELDSVMSRTHLIVHPSLTEAMPNALIRAQSIGLPAVATNVGGIPEVLEDSVTGLLVPPADPLSLANAIREILTDKDTWSVFSRNAYQYTPTRFSPRKEIEAYQSFYRAIL